MLRTAKRLQLMTGDGAAWRAFYLYYAGRPLVSLGLDPTFDYVNWHVFGSIGRRSFRLVIPGLRWRMHAGPVRRRLYAAQERLRHRLDGRYGWGGSCRRKAVR